MTDRTDSTTPTADLAARLGSHDAGTGRTSRGHKMQLAPANIHNAIAAGAALDVQSGFSMPSNNGQVGYSVQLVLGAGAVASAILFTIYGLDLYGNAITVQTTISAGAGTYEVVDELGEGIPFSETTRITTDVDVQGTTTLQTLDLYTATVFRGVWLNTAGDVVLRLSEDAGDTPYTGSVGSIIPDEYTRIRCSKAGRTGISPSTASVTIGR